jgi:hypothetical protein
MSFHRARRGMTCGRPGPARSASAQSVMSGRPDQMAGRGDDMPDVDW